MKHYHTISGLQGGYIPNSNTIHTSRRDAVRGAQWIIDAYRSNDERVVGSAKAGFWQARRVSFGFADYIEVSGPCFDQCEDWDD